MSEHREGTLFYDTETGSFLYNSNIRNSKKEG